MTKPNKIFAFLSIVLLFSDIAIVAINYFMAHHAFDLSLQERGERQRRSYALALNMEMNNMLRMASFIAKDREIQQLFWQGKQAVTSEGGGAGGPRATQARQALLKKVGPAWQHLQEALDVRQFHFHLGPGSLSFLRVHRPEKFGDRMDGLRHIIVDTNHDHQSRTGFETGRVYSGLRGVVPVFYTHEQSGEKVHVGTLELGTSLGPMLKAFDSQTKTGIAALLRAAHVRDAMWPEMIRETFKKLSAECQCAIESTSREHEFEAVLHALLPTMQQERDNRLYTKVIPLHGGHVAVTHFPLYDYRGKRDKYAGHVGRIVMWSDISGEMAALNNSIRTNAAYALAAFVIIEILLYLAIRIMNARLLKEIEASTEALRESRHAVQQANARFRAVLDGSDAIIYVADMQTYELLYANRTLRETIGERTGELCWRVLKSGQSGPCAFCTNDKLLDAQGRPSGTYVWESQNTQTGKWYHCSDSAIPWDDRLVRLEIASDISEIKQVQADLAAAKHAAEVANRAKSAFLANMSHELRTPLNAVLGFAQILAEDAALSREQRRQIDSIKRGGEYLSTLINDILDLAKIEAGRFELFPKTWHTQEFFQGLREVFEMRASQKGIGFEYQATELPHKLYCDDKRLRQILMNLLSNAIKFTEQGQVVLRAGFARGSLELEVEDTGIGISAQEQEKIFEPFTQLGAIHHKQQGTGLGLSITRRLVDAMQGELSVVSRAGAGSCFRVRMPAEAISTLIEATPHDTRRASGYRRTAGSGPLHLLIVEDIADNREVLRKLLEPLQFTLSETESGEHCLELVQSRRPDAILMDLRLTGMDGLETTRRLRATSGFESVPIIAVSASAFNDSRDNALAAGCNDHVSKPVHLRELLQTLARHLPMELLYTAQAPSSPAETKPALTPEQRETLLRLLSSGDVMSLQAYLKQQIEQAHTPGLEKLLELAESFQLTEIRKRLQ